ncbi:MAG: ATP-binding protein [Dehalococcoidales bacterium]|nr:ATP-binding protein [Dehalococcoidales bacterium]
MEHIGEILNRMRTRINTSGEDTDTWSSVEKSPESQSEDLCPICKGAGFVHPRMESGKPDYSRVVPCVCKKRIIEKEKDLRLYRYSNLGVLASYNFESLARSGLSGDSRRQQMFSKAFEAAKEYAADPRGWFVLVGPSGSGKTFLAAAIANERIRLGQPAFFQTVPDLLDHLRSAFAPDSDIPYDELFETVSNTPLLILDDLGVQASTAWAKEKLDQLLNHRYLHELPTVITTSIPVEEMEERIRTRVGNARLSRIFEIEEKTSALQSYSWGKGFELQKILTFKTFDSKRLNLPLEQRQNLEWAYQVALQYAESPDGWLVLQGVNGCGKTHLAAAIVNYRYEARRPAIFVVVPEFLDHLRRTFNPESKVSYDQLFEAVKTAQLLVLDDFGEQSTTPWAQEKLYQVINCRYNARLATVITTFYSLDEIESRISSRLVDPRISMVINITAPDYRGDKSSNPEMNKNSFRRLKKQR